MGGCASAPEVREAPYTMEPPKSFHFKRDSEDEHAHFGLRTHKIIKPLGEGGTGETYLVKRNDNQVEEAVKVIRRPVPKALQELLTNEIVLQSSIGEGHDSIVQARSVILTETHICLFMDFISGGTLADLVHDKAAVKQPGKLVMDEDEARYIFRQCIEAIDYCHSQDIAHRDIKLDNLLLDEQSPPHVKLCDFGFAKLMGNCSLTTQIGTPQYMAPQHSLKDRNGYCGKATDVWACGVLLFVMLKGAFPFQHSSAAEDNYQKAFAEVHLEHIKFHWTENPKNADAVKHMSPELVDLMNKIFEVDEAKRITMEEIKEHPWYKAPMREQFEQSMEAIVAQQTKLNKFMKRHGDVGLTRQSDVITALVAAACEMGEEPSAQALALQDEEISLLRMKSAAPPPLFAAASSA